MSSINDPTPQMKLTKKLLDDYSSRDLSDVGPFLSENFKFQTFPKVAELPEEEKGSHINNWGKMLGSFAKMEPTIHEVIEAPGKVVLHLTSTWSTVQGAKLEYHTLLVVTFVEEEGILKVLDIKDFSDPQKRSAIHAEVAKATGILVA